MLNPNSTGEYYKLTVPTKDDQPHFHPFFHHATFEVACFPKDEN